ncbi:hypothetical protein [Streptomyces sp. NPDC101181]|uniref:hypothetical protein n=1 Tax=Streptomyces sp. NPDC101181 TaxID=3366125 RepID=UPI00381E3D4B
MRSLRRDDVRFITGIVAPHAAAHPNDKRVRHIVAQLNYIEPILDRLPVTPPQALRTT